MGLHINPEALKEAGFHSVKRSTLRPSHHQQDSTSHGQLALPSGGAHAGATWSGTSIGQKFRLLFMAQRRTPAGGEDEAWLLAHWICTLPQSFSKLAPYTLQP